MSEDTRRWVNLNAEIDAITGNVFYATSLDYKRTHIVIPRDEMWEPDERKVGDKRFYVSAEWAEGVGVYKSKRPAS
jgi:hypothetical protein